MNKIVPESRLIIDIQNSLPSDCPHSLPESALIEQWVCAALAHEKVASAELTIRLVDSAEMRMLNNRYRHKDYPTNVLSFPADIHSEVELEAPFLGDIVLCAPVVQEESVEQSTSLMAHWAHMVIHGVLHLLGHDHQNDIEADIMESKEIAILGSMQIENPYEDNEELK